MTLSGCQSLTIGSLPGAPGGPAALGDPDGPGGPAATSFRTCAITSAMMAIMNSRWAAIRWPIRSSISAPLSPIAVFQAVTTTGSALSMVLDLLILDRRCAPDVVGAYLAGCPASMQLRRHSTCASWLG